MFRIYVINGLNLLKQTMNLMKLHLLPFIQQQVLQIIDFYQTIRIIQLLEDQIKKHVQYFNL